MVTTAGDSPRLQVVEINQQDYLIEEKPIMAAKRRHHYVPRFYLKGFIDPTNEPFLWVYENGKPQPLRINYENAGFQRDYYAFARPDGTRDTNTVEDLFCLTESSAASVLRKIVNHEEITGQDKANFAYFMAFLLMRVPRFRNHIEKLNRALIKRFAISLASNREAFYSMIQDFEASTGRKVDTDLEEHRRFWLSDRYRVVSKPIVSLGAALKLPNDVWRIFNQMKWKFLIPPDGERYLTSDNPVFYCDPARPDHAFGEIGLMDRRIEVSLPLTRSIALLAGWKSQEGYSQTSGAVVRMMNRRTIIGFERFIYSSENRAWIPTLISKHGTKADKASLD